MSKLIILIVGIVLSSSKLYSQVIEPYVNKGFLIILSTKDYNSALKVAKEASNNLDLDLDLRGYYPDSTAGLKTDEVCGCGEVHGYVARGRYDDGMFVSIEYSDSFNSFTSGYYIVIVASGDRKELNLELSNVKAFYSDAYIKNSDVYIGCMH